MAIRCSYPQILTQGGRGGGGGGGGAMKKTVVNKVFMLHNNGGVIPINKKPTPLPRLQIRSSTNDNKVVFEDQSRGIVCYKDENGEIICEGYDEGPRFHKQISTKTYHQKDLRIVELLERSWSKIAEEDGIHPAEKGVAAQEDFDRNGFKRYYC